MASFRNGGSAARFPRPLEDLGPITRIPRLHRRHKRGPGTPPPAANGRTPHPNPARPPYPTRSPCRETARAAAELAATPALVPRPRRPDGRLRRRRRRRRPAGGLAGAAGLSGRRRGCYGRDRQKADIAPNQLHSVLDVVGWIGPPPSHLPQRAADSTTPRVLRARVFASHLVAVLRSCAKRSKYDQPSWQISN